MKKIVFSLALIFISSCSEYRENNRVLTQKICENEKQTIKCTEGCKPTGKKFSKFTFKEDINDQEGGDLLDRSVRDSNRTMDFITRSRQAATCVFH